MHQFFLYFCISYMLLCCLDFYSEGDITNALVCALHTKVCIQTTDWPLYNHVQIMQNILSKRKHQCRQHHHRFCSPEHYYLGQALWEYGLNGAEIRWHKSLAIYGAWIRVWDIGRWLYQLVSKCLALILLVFYSVKSPDIFIYSKTQVGLQILLFSLLNLRAELGNRWVFIGLVIKRSWHWISSLAWHL